MAAGTGSAGDGGVQVCAVRGFIRNIDVADSFTGQTQGLGPGVADDGVGVNGGDEGNFNAAVNQFPVGFVRNQIDGMTVCGALGGQQVSQFSRV